MMYQESYLPVLLGPLVIDNRNTLGLLVVYAWPPATGPSHVATSFRVVQLSRKAKPLELLLG